MYIRWKEKDILITRISSNRNDIYQREIFISHRSMRCSDDSQSVVIAFEISLQGERGGKKKEGRREEGQKGGWMKQESMMRRWRGES